MQTAGGRAFDLLRPQASDVDFDEVSAALSKLCRFAGHTREFYSVAEHSVHVASILPKEMQLYGLLHDAHEAYLGDWPTPVKVALGRFSGDAAQARRQLEIRVQKAVHEAAGLPEPDVGTRLAIHEADMRVLLAERAELMAPPPKAWDGGLEEIVPADVTLELWEPKLADFAFRLHFRELTDPPSRGGMLARLLRARRLWRGWR